MEFVIKPSMPNSSRILVKFFRSYTTQHGSSVIGHPRVVAEQLSSLRADVLLGNFAVLHWQQNMRKSEDWKRNLEQFKAFFAAHEANIPFKYYFGHTLIQMGRTQGLQPSRTELFSSTARETLTQWRYFDPYNLSLSRRESAFDGQHWACYHEYGGVSLTIMQLFLSYICYLSNII